MAQKQCAKCGEMVDEAKAFCPGCGNAFVEEEKRTGTSGFEAMDHTVQLGKTMYGKMLSDMGLNISKTPTPAAPDPRRVEVMLQPEPAAVNPKVPSPTASAKPGKAAQKPSSLKWWILGGVILVLLFAVIMIAAALYFLYGPHLR